MANFIKDIVIVDFENTDFDIEKSEPVQIGVLVLDKDTLDEKQSYVSWIKPIQNVHKDLQGFKWANISNDDIEEINKARPLAEVAEELYKILPEQYIFCAWNAAFDFYLWNKLLQSIGKKRIAAQILDLWTMAYLDLMNDDKYQGDYGSESVFQYFGAEPRKKHDGLGDCRLEAMLFKKLLDRQQRSS